MAFEFFGLVFGTKEEVSATIQTLVVAFWVIFEGWTALQDRIQFNRKCLTKTTYFISSQWLKKAHDETIIIQKEIQNYDIFLSPVGSRHKDSPDISFWVACDDVSA